MRFAFVGYSYGVDPRLIGGHQSCLRRLAAYLSGVGHSVDFIIFGEAEEGCSALAKRVTLYCVSTFDAAVGQLCRSDYDYVQLSCIPRHIYPAAIRYLARRRRINRARHGYFYIVRPPWRLMHWVRIVMFKLFYDVVVAVSPRLQADLVRFSIPHCLWLPPVPDHYFATELPTGPLEEVNVAYVGRVDADKGVQNLIPILEQLQARHPRVHASIWGYYYPHSQASLDLHRYLESQDCIAYEGRSYRDYSPEQEAQLLARLRATDILVLPYKTLAGITVDVPVLLLEAMAVGCGVITTRVADLLQIVGDPELCAIDREAILPAIERLLQEDHLARKRARLRARSEELGVRLSEAGPRFLIGVGLA